MNTIIRGIILGLSITAPIGPTNVEVIRRGTREGWQSAAAFCLGTMVALILFLLLVVAGFSFLTELPVFNALLTALGVAVLAYLAYVSIKDFLHPEAEIDLDNHASPTQHFVPGILLTISNPAILLIWTGIMGVDLAASRASVDQGLLLSLGILIGVGLFFAFLTTVIHYCRRLLRREYLRYVSLAAGVVLLFFCVSFARGFLIEYVIR
jgi:threonine/homoserine/homoserine lactone efflux protein